MFPDGSVNEYVTMVRPSLKNEPGVCVRDARVAVPELSVAVASSHSMAAPPRPVKIVS